jgi:shikimate kinase
MLSQYHPFHRKSRMTNNPQILILLGPNGAGKTTIGRLLAKRFACQFFSPEEFFMARYATIEEYRADRNTAYHALEDQIRAAAQQTIVVVEEVGLSDVSRAMIENLQRDYAVRLIKITADESTCLQRVEARGTTHNFAKTPDFVSYVHDAFTKQAIYPFDLEIQNKNLTEDEITQLFQPFFTEG